MREEHGTIPVRVGVESYEHGGRSIVIHTREAIGTDKRWDALRLAASIIVAAFRY